MENVILFLLGASSWAAFRYFVSYKESSVAKPSSEGAPKLIRLKKERRKPKAMDDEHAFKAEIEEMKRAERL